MKVLPSTCSFHLNGHTLKVLSTDLKVTMKNHLVQHNKQHHRKIIQAKSSSDQVIPWQAVKKGH